MKSTILIIDCGSSKVSDIEKALEAINIDSVTVSWDKIKPEKAADHPGIIISGAPILLTETDPTPYLFGFNFLLDYPNPVLGICFGHQILGMLHGAQISNGKENRGWQEIDIELSSTLFNYVRKPFEMMEDHQEEITIPDGFKLLASSKNCKVEAMQHKIKPLFGVQFHPEVSERKGLQLLKNFCKICY